MTEEQKRYIIQQYEHGRNKPKAIAEELGVTMLEVKGFAFRHGYAHRSHKYKQEDDSRIISVLNSLAKELRTEPPNVARHIYFLLRNGKI